AIERRPSSTLKRRISKKLAVVRKFRAIMEKIAISPKSASTSTCSPLGEKRARHDLDSVRSKAGLPHFRATAQRFNRDRRQNHHALQCQFPVSARAQENQSWSNGAKQDYPQHSSCDTAAPARNRRTAYNYCSNNLYLQSKPGIAGNLVEAHGVKYGRHYRQSAGHNENQKHHTPRIDSRYACRFRV